MTKRNATTNTNATRLTPRSRLAWMAAVALWLPALPVGAETLRWKLAEGDRLDVSLKQVTETETAILGAASEPAKISLKMELRSRWEVEQATAESATIRQAITAVIVQMDNAQGDRVVYDSTSGMPPENAAARELGDALKGLVGAEFIVKMTPRGEILSLDIPEDKAEKLKPAAAGRLGGVLAPQELQSALQKSTLQLPEAAIALGGEWETAEKLQAALGELQLTRHYTLRQDTAEGQPARIDLTGKIQLNRPKQADGAKTRLLRSKLTGQYEFDIAAGRLNHSDIQMETVADTTYRDQRVAVRVASRIETTVRTAK